MSRISDATMDIIKMIDLKYPSLNILQLGYLVLLLGGLRVVLGHTDASDTCRHYSHVLVSEDASDEIKECMHFLEREVFSFTKSRIDVDVYKTGNKRSGRPDIKYREEKDEHSST